MKKGLFNMTSTAINRQLSVPSMEPSDAPPIVPNFGTLEPCISGAKKINADPEVRSLVKEILTGEA